MNKKILFIINSLGKGGAERVVANLANSMANRNYEVHIITLYNDVFYELDEKVKLYCLKSKKYNGKIARALESIKLKKNLNKFIKTLEADRRYDLITIHLPFAHYICKNINISSRSLFVIHTVYSRKINRFKFLSTKLIQSIYKNKKIITVSDGVRGELKNQWKVKSSFIQTINNPINLNYIENMSKEPLELNYKYIVFVGRLTKLKRADLLLNSYLKSSLNNKYKLVFIGDGEEKEKLSQKVRALKLEKSILFKGWQLNPFNWIKNSELLVSCSEYEAFPMNIVEALACDAKVVSVDCDYGPREIMTGDLSEYLVPTNDENSLSIKMEKAIVNYPSNIKNYAEKYDIEKIIDRYMEAANV